MFIDDWLKDYGDRRGVLQSKDGRIDVLSLSSIYLNPERLEKGDTLLFGTTKLIYDGTTWQYLAE